MASTIQHQSRIYSDVCSCLTWIEDITVPVFSRLNVKVTKTSYVLSVLLNPPLCGCGLSRVWSSLIQRTLNLCCYWGIPDTPPRARSTSRTAIRLDLKTSSVSTTARLKKPSKVLLNTARTVRHCTHSSMM